MGIKDVIDKLAAAVGAVPAVDRSKRVLTTGEPVPEDNSHTANRGDGQQRGYVVLSEEERRRGFVRPVRRSYMHVGRPPPANPIRDVTSEENVRYPKSCGYVKYEAYPPGSTILGRYWSQDMLDQIGNGCGGVTTMDLAIAETYARDPKFYGGTFCSRCGAHFSVGADGQFVWLSPEGDITTERVGT